MGNAVPRCSRASCRLLEDLLRCFDQDRMRHKTLLEIVEVVADLEDFGGVCSCLKVRVTVFVTSVLLKAMLFQACRHAGRLTNNLDRDSGIDAVGPQFEKKY